MTFHKWIGTLTFCSCLSLIGNPSGSNVINGTVNIMSSDNLLQITASDKSIIEWQDFSNQLGETVNFIQPNSSAAILNRVVGLMPSDIQGMVTGNGQIYLVNPQGIIFGPECQINAAALFASTLDITNANFISGLPLTFSGNSEATILNMGTLQTTDGDLGLFGLFVSNIGSLSASGDVLLGSASNIVLQPPGMSRIFINPMIATGPSDDTQTQIFNSGTIEAVAVEVNTFRNVYGLAFQHEGTIDALDPVSIDGHVYLLTTGGMNQINGSISAQNSDGSGGEVHVLGDFTYLLDHAAIDVSGDSGSGTVLVGGSFQGMDPNIPKSQQTYFAGNATVNANALTAGNGGEVVIWSDGATLFYGSITSKGGSVSGNGGNAEVSGLQYLDDRGMVDLSAPNGTTGTLLLDPPDILITTLGVQTGAFSGCIPPDTYTPPAVSSVLLINSGANPLLTHLQTCDVVVLAATGNITVGGPIAMTPAHNHNLTLQAGGNILFNAGSTFTNNTTANGNLSLIAAGSITTNNTFTFGLGSVGGLTMTANGGITVANTITLNGANNFTLNDNGGNCGAPTATLISHAIQNTGAIGASGTVILNKAGPGTLNIQPPNGVSAAVGSLNSLTQINAPEADVTLQSSFGGLSQLGFFMTFGQLATGPISVNCYNLNLLGQTLNSGNSGMAQIGHGNPNGNGAGVGTATLNSDITVTAANDVILTGGIRQAFAWIGHGSFRAAGAALGDPSANQIGNITVTAGRNITLDFNNPAVATLNNAVIGHGIGDSGGGSFVTQITGNIFVSSGCDINLLSTPPTSNLINIGTFWNVGGTISNINSDIDIIAGRDLNIVYTNAANGSIPITVGHFPPTNLTGQERIRVGRDLNITKSVALNKITLGLSGNTNVQGDFELLVNRDLNITSTVSAAAASTTISIGIEATNVASNSNSYIAVGRDMIISAPDGAIQSSVNPGNLVVAVGRNLEVTEVAGSPNNFYIGTNNYVTNPGATTYIWAGGHIKGTNAAGGTPQVVFGFGQNALPLLANRTCSLDMRAAGDIQFSNNGLFAFETSNAGSIFISANNNLGSLWTNSGAQLTQIDSIALPAPLQVSNASLPPVPSVCLTACNCTAAASFCNPPACPQGCMNPTASPFAANEPFAPTGFGGFYVQTNLASNLTTFETNTGSIQIFSGCKLEDGVTANNISLGSIADNPADTVRFLINSGDVDLAGFNTINVNQSASFPSPATAANFTGNITLRACTDINVNRAIITQGAGKQISLNSDMFNTGTGNINMTAATSNITSNDGPIILNAGFGGAAGTSAINQNFAQVNSNGGMITAQAVGNVNISSPINPAFTSAGGNQLIESKTMNVNINQTIVSTSGNFNIIADMGTIFINPPVGTGGAVNSTAGGSIMMFAGTDIDVDGKAPSVTTTTGSITMNADNNVNLSQTVTSTAGGSVSITSDADNSGTGDINFLTPTANVTTVNAPIVLSAGFGAAAGTSAINQNFAQVNSNGGMITAHAVGNVNISSPIDPAFTSAGGNQLIESKTMNVNINQTIVSTSGNFNIIADMGTIFINPPVGTGGSVNSTAGGSITMFAGTDIDVNGKAPSVTTTAGSITMNANNNVNLSQTVTSTAGGSVSITSDADNSGTGDINFLTPTANVTTVNAPIVLSAGFGAAAGTSAINQNFAQVNSNGGMITAHAVGNVNISSPIDPAFTSAGGNQLIESKTMNVNINQTIVSTSGNFNIIADMGTIFINPPVGTGGSVNSTAGGSITMFAGTDIDVNGKAPSVTTTAGSITMNANNDVNLSQTVTSTAGGSISITSDADNSGTGNINFLTPTADVTSNNAPILLSAGFSANSGTSAINQNFAQVNSNGGSITDQAVGNIFINGAPVSQTSGAGAISMTTTRGNIEVDQDVVSTSGDVNGLAVIGNINFFNGGSIQTDTGNINLNAGNNIVVNGDPTTLFSNFGFIHTFSGNNTSIFKDIMTCGEILIIANVNIALNNTNITSTCSDVTLVVDQAFSARPTIGPGIFTSTGSTVRSGQFFGSLPGSLRIFTALQQRGVANNQITGSLFNGANPFNAPYNYPITPILTDTPYEVWCVYFSDNPNFPYPMPNLGTPFTIFYKQCIAPIVEAANVVVSQVLFSFNPPDEWNQDWLYPYFPPEIWLFKLFYDPIIKNRHQELYWLSRRGFSMIHNPHVYWYSSDNEMNLALKKKSHISIETNDLIKDFLGIFKQLAPY